MDIVLFDEIDNSQQFYSDKTSIYTPLSTIKEFDITGIKNSNHVSLDNLNDLNIINNLNNDLKESNESINSSTDTIDGHRHLLTCSQDCSSFCSEKEKTQKKPQKNFQRNETTDTIRNLLPSLQDCKPFSNLEFNFKLEEKFVNHNISLSREFSPFSLNPHDSNRFWKIFKFNEELLSTPPVVEIEQKHRREKRHKEVDENLFSSSRYEVFVTIFPSQKDDIEYFKNHTIHAHLVPYEILSNGDLRPLTCINKFDGINHATFRKHPKSRKFKDALYSDQLLIHFDSSLSHYFTNNDYLMDLEIYSDSVHSFDQFHEIRHLLTLRSPIVRVYARKANKKSPEDLENSQIHTESLQSLGKRKRNSSFSKRKNIVESTSDFN